MAGRPSGQDEAWLPTGFPPRSFPPAGSVLPPTKPPPGPRRGRGRWLAVAAICAAVVLLVGALLLASRGGDDESDVATGSSTSSSETSLLPEIPTTAVALPPSIDPVSTTMPGATTTILTPADPPGVLETSAASLTLPRADTTAGVTQARLALRNTGATALAFTTQASSPALTAAPARGTIPPGASSNLVVTLDGARVDEGPFTGTLTFGGTGGDRAVQVQAIVGQPPEITDEVGQRCSPPSNICSQQIALSPNASPGETPCDTTWFYAVAITDQSQIVSVRAIARLNQDNADSALRRAGSTDIYQSQPFNRLPEGTVLRFAIEAVDEYGFSRLLPEQVIACP